MDDPNAKDCGPLAMVDAPIEIALCAVAWANVPMAKEAVPVVLLPDPIAKD